MLVIPCVSAFNYTVGSYGYNFGQEITATMPVSSEAQTNYQVRVNVSSSTGVSTATTVYTNGTARSDWYDLVFTDTSNSILPYWLENGTTTSSTAYAWVKLPSITTDGATKFRVYYGNSTKTTSSMDGLNTFPIWDDFYGLPDGTLNRTKWNVITGMPHIASGYYMAVVNASTDDVASNAVFDWVNYSVRMRIYTTNFGLSTMTGYTGFVNTSTLNATLAALGNVTDTYQGASVHHVTSEISAFSISGSGNLVLLEAYRDYANDTLADAARLISIRLKYGRTV